MPTYEFKCDVCQMSQAVDGSMHGETLAPLCCGQLCSRVWSAPAISFKGDGWGYQ